MSAGLFAIWCELSGFDLGAFDRWLERLPACGAKQELTARRAAALAAFEADPNAREGILRHLEWMQSRRREIQREDALLPLAKARKKQIDALPRPDAGEMARKEKHWAELQAWVLQQHDDYPWLSYEQIKQKAVKESRATMATMKRHTTRWK